jgi:hypothetical protein
VTPVCQLNPGGCSIEEPTEEGICGQGVSSCAAYDTVESYFEQVGGA